MPPSAEYWHMGETKMRFLNSSSRSFSGVKSFVMMKSLVAQYRDVAYLGTPFGRPAGVDGMALGIDCHRDWHILHHKFVNRFHAKVGERHHPRRFDGFRNQVGSAADSDEVNRLVALDGFDGGIAALGLAYHAQQAGFFQH